MRTWKHKLQVWNIHQIWEAVDDADWQAFRISLKGISTEEKLQRLDEYLRIVCVLHQCTVDEIQFKNWKEKCRVDNYINAILRGGQLKHVEGEIVVQR